MVFVHDGQKVAVVTDMLIKRLDSCLHQAWCMCSVTEFLSAISVTKWKEVVDLLSSEHIRYKTIFEWESPIFDNELL
jgi:hypothetical protein